MKFVSMVASSIALVSASLLAAGILNPWTSADKKFYEDNTYLGASAKIEAFVPEAGSSSGNSNAGSGTEPTVPANEFEVRVTLPAGAGSLSEEARYVAKGTIGSATPQKIELFPADAEWKEAGSSSEGELEIETWSKENLSGKLFGYELEAAPKVEESK